LFTVPDASPLNVQAENTWTPHTIPLRWTHIPVHLLNGILTGYRIRYQAIEMGQCPYEENPREVIIPAENVSTVLKGLESFAVYRIEVTGLTIKGDGPSEVIFAGNQRYLLTYREQFREFNRNLAVSVPLPSTNILIEKTASFGGSFCLVFTIS